ncbi:MAG: GatB/YqeY domain-containing protein [Gammaproteobacteria bacterium]|nr:MAG: GatB/YqeY domain-containing protein [Gammaproteobacteria bacterium]|tara:strand:+ start:226 stop:678 length:453 start_codon:yes stop_codon:yes gene_type:complete
MANTIRPLIEEAVKLSMRERNKDKTSTLRMAVSELKKEEIDTRTEITDETSIRILQRMIKQRKESMSQFNDAGREELAEKEALEISILEEFMPQQMEEDEIRIIVSKVIETSGATNPQDMGKVMGMLKSEFQGNADMGLVSKIVKESLTI